MTKKALITGITGQDGSLLAEFLLGKSRLDSGNAEHRTMPEFVTLAFEYAGKPIEWHGKDVEEYATLKSNGEVTVRVNPRFYRPAEVEKLLGNSAKAEKDPVRRMVENDIKMVDNSHK